MSTLVRLAWRNLGRNPRRTALTASAGVFAAFLTLLTLALAKGSHERWIDDVVRLYPGHYEVSLEGYREHRTLDYGMTLDAATRRGLDALPRLEGWTPRLESWALAMADREGSAGRPAWLVGVDPQKEGRLTTLGRAIGAGRPVGAEPRREVVLGEVLARNLGVEPGDSVILVAADYYGSQSADRFEVVGTLAVGAPDFDSYSAILDLRTLQQFLEMGDGLSHVAVFVADSEAIAPLGPRLAAIFPEESYEVVPWDQLVPDVVQYILLDDIGAWLMLTVLIVVVGFGLLNTVLMMVLERVREFGVLRALGMKPRAVFALVMLESVQLAALGIAVGLALAIPLVLWGEQHPIPFGGESMAEMFELFELSTPVIEFSLSARQLIGTPLVLIAVSLLAALPPALRAARGRPVDALRET